MVPGGRVCRGEGLIEDGDWVGHAIGGGGDGGGVERGVVRQAMEHLRTLAGPTELAGQRFIYVELRGYGTAAIEVKVVLAAQLALLAQGRLAGRALLLEITKSMWEVKSKKSYHKVRGKKTQFNYYIPTCKLRINNTRTATILFIDQMIHRLIKKRISRLTDKEKTH